MSVSRSRFSPRRQRAKPKKQGLDPEQLEEIREAFNLFDTDGNGAHAGWEFARRRPDEMHAWPQALLTRAS